MTGKYDALIAEADRIADADDAATYREMWGSNPDIIRRLATALREAQAHVPTTDVMDAFWRQSFAAALTGITANQLFFGPEYQGRTDLAVGFARDCAAAAMAAIEEVK